MVFSEWRTSFLINTSLSDKLSFVEELYGAFDRDLEGFSSKAWTVCPPGCGKCCEGFEPDLFEPEALYIAAYLFLLKPELAPLLEEAVGRTASGGGARCPLYDGGRAEHCPVYPVRGLVCRGFAFSSVVGKKGLEFRLCSNMSDRGRRSWVGGEILEEFGVEPPVLAGYGRRLEAGSGCSALRENLGSAVRKSLLKLRYYSELTRPEGGGSLPRSA